MTRAWLALVLLAIAVTRTQAAEPAAAPAPAGPDLDKDLAAVFAAPGGDARVAAAQKLAYGPDAVDALAKRLGRARTSTDDDRRAVLARFYADVPTPGGKFKDKPPLKKGEKPAPDPDWLVELAKLDAAEPAVKDSLEIVVLVRALAATHDPRAADAILEFSFTPDGTTFRDECGRQIRGMSPWSLPTLVRASRDFKKAGGAWARYASFQLERLGKNRPSYVLDAADEDVLEIALLKIYGDTKPADAVVPVLDRCDAAAPSLRTAARDAFMQFVTGPEPPPAPKAKRRMAGGKISDEELPLFLTYREMAEQELKRRLDAAGQKYGKRATAEQLTKQLFDLWDQARAARFDEQMTAALELAKAQKWPEAAAAYDAILVMDPLYPRRAEMTPAYLALGKSLAGASKWDAAALAFEKAYSLDPTGPSSKDARAELHYARARVLEAAGKPAEDELEQALAANPEHPGARSALTVVKKTEARARGAWMLWAAAAAGGAAVVLFALGMRRRRAA